MPQYYPGHGRTVIPSRLAEEKKPYIYQAYPSHRFHPDGRELIVQSAADEEERCPESEGWVKTPFPAKPKSVAVPEQSASELKLQLDSVTGAFARLKVHFDDQTKTYNMAYQQLSTEHEKLKGYSMEQSNQLLELRKQLDQALEQVRTLTPPVPEEVQVKAESAGKKK